MAPAPDWPPSWWKTRRRATRERALRRSGADYRAVVEQATVRHLSLERSQGRFLKVNPALVAMLGYDSEVPGPRRRPRRRRVRSARRARPGDQERRGVDRITGTEVQWKRKDGHRIIVRLSGSGGEEARRAM